MRKETSLNDIVFVAVFSVVVFFGAFFIFSSLKNHDAKRSNKVSVKELERSLNRKVSRKIKRLNGKRLALETKILKRQKDLKFEDINFEEDADEKNKYSLDLYKKQENTVSLDLKDKSAADRVLNLIGIEDGSSVQKQEAVESYRLELIKKARAAGWKIEISEDLEITSAVPL